MLVIEWPDKPHEETTLRPGMGFAWEEKTRCLFVFLEKDPGVRVVFGRYTDKRDNKLYAPFVRSLKDLHETCLLIATCNGWVVNRSHYGEREAFIFGER